MTLNNIVQIFQKHLYFTELAFLKVFLFFFEFAYRDIRRVIADAKVIFPASFTASPPLNARARLPRMEVLSSPLAYKCGKKSRALSRGDLFSRKMITCGAMQMKCAEALPFCVLSARFNDAIKSDEFVTRGGLRSFVF